MKHYLGYSGPRTGRDRTPASLTEREVKQYYLPTFRAAVAAVEADECGSARNGRVGLRDRG